MNILLPISFLFCFISLYLNIKKKEVFLQWFLIYGLLSVIAFSTYLGDKRFGLNSILYNLLKYADEISIFIVLLLLPFTPKFRFQFDKTILLGLVFSLIGSLSAVAYGRETTPMLLATFLTLKPFFIFFLFKTLPFNFKESHTTQVIAILSLIVIFGGVIDILFSNSYRPIISSYPNEVRFGIKFVSGVFWHPASQATLAALLVIYNYATLQHSKMSKNFYEKYKIIGLLIFVFWATRIKQIIGLLIALAIRKLSFKGITIAIILGIGLFWGYKTFLPDHYNGYFNTVSVDKNARQALTFTSLKIATDYFPFGTGFGTFASPISRDYYSPVYNQYGISNIYGLSKGTGFFICDTFWPIIIGETGILGLIFYLLFWFFIIYRVIINGRNNAISEFFIMYFVFIFITSLATTSLLNKEGYVLFAIAGYLMNPYHSNFIKKKDDYI